MRKTRLSKTALAESFGISRSLLYYRHKKPQKDWLLKQQIEEVLHAHPSYGHRRIALALKRNKKAILRVMNKFGIKPYRRRVKRWKKPENNKDQTIYPNLLLVAQPHAPNHIWASDFTHIAYRQKWLYLATVIDLLTRKIVGWHVLLHHKTELVIGALFAAVHNHPPPGILHSDRGSEYLSKDYQMIVQKLGIRISMSRAGCPWENGYQESFYGKFKVDLGDPHKFSDMGELIYEIYRMIHVYNHTRIHSALKTSPVLFEREWRKHKHPVFELDRVSKERGA